MAEHRMMPTIVDAAHTHATYSGAEAFGVSGLGAGNFVHEGAAAGDLMLRSLGGPIGLNEAIEQNAIVQRQRRMISENVFKNAANNALTPQQKETDMPQRRLVKVVIIDPNENLSLDDCVLFNGDEKLTDATDQELFFELDIKGMLEEHNEHRITVVDRKVKDRVEHLEPVKIRELKMVVVTIAAF